MKTYAYEIPINTWTPNGMLSMYTRGLEAWITLYISELEGCHQWWCNGNSGGVKRENIVFDQYFSELTHHLATAIPLIYVYCLCVFHNGIYPLEFFRLSKERTWINRQENSIGAKGESLLPT